MAEYQLTAYDTTILRTGDGVWVSIDPNNAAYAEYLAWLDAGNVPDPYVPPPPPVPNEISDRQFFQQLAIEGVISQDEALASNAAVIPPALLKLIEGLPPEAQFGAKMIVSGATTYYRNDPLTITIGTAYGWSSEQIDAFFQAASAL